MEGGRKPACTKSQFHSFYNSISAQHNSGILNRQGKKITSKVKRPLSPLFGWIYRSLNGILDITTISVNCKGNCVQEVYSLLLLTSEALVAFVKHVQGVKINNQSINNVTVWKKKIISWWTFSQIKVWANIVPYIEFSNVMMHWMIVNWISLGLDIWSDLWIPLSVIL